MRKEVINMLTVKELREKLNLFPDDAKCWGWDDGSIIITHKEKGSGWIDSDTGEARLMSLHFPEGET